MFRGRGANSGVARQDAGSAPPAAAGISRISEVPNEFLCPITQEVMRDPATDACGHSYEHAAIEEWLRGHRTCPLTNLPLAHTTLTRNHALRNVIEMFMHSMPEIQRRNIQQRQAALDLQAIIALREEDLRALEEKHGGAVREQMRMEEALRTEHVRVEQLTAEVEKLKRALSTASALPRRVEEMFPEAAAVHPLAPPAAARLSASPSPRAAMPANPYGAASGPGFFQPEDPSSAMKGSSISTPLRQAWTTSRRGLLSHPLTDEEVAQAKHEADLILEKLKQRRRKKSHGGFV